MTRKIELQELLNLGLSEKAGKIYSKSDYSVYAEGSGLFTLKIRHELISGVNTIEDLSASFESDYYASLDGRVIFDNGGGITLQLGEYAHYYQSESQAAEDLFTYLTDGNTDDWDGHEEDALEHEPTDDQLSNGGYRVYSIPDIVDAAKDPDRETGWGNIEAFCTALAQK